VVVHVQDEILAHDREADQTDIAAFLFHSNLLEDKARAEAPAILVEMAHLLKAGLAVLRHLADRSIVEQAPIATVVGVAVLSCPRCRLTSSTVTCRVPHDHDRD
jgi:hypothetical protein